MDTDCFTLDSIWNSQTVKILQPKRGYRFALDAILLAHFLKIEPQEEALEIGSGSGVITVLLSRLQKFKRVVAVEVQHSLAELSKENFRLNAISNAQALEADIKMLEKFLDPNSFDLIFSNPPYRKTGTGKLNPSQQKAIARHELKMKLENLFECADKFLKEGGRFSLILPKFREADFLRMVKHYQFQCREKRYVHSIANEVPAFFLATISRIGGNLVEYPPLIVYDSPGVYGAEVQRMLNEKVSHDKHGHMHEFGAGLAPGEMHNDASTL
jgi:tRNA1Val (adenine37-N6)-methyltransferase